MTFALDSYQMSLIAAGLVGLIIGLVLVRGGPRRQRAVFTAEEGRLKAEIEARDTRINALERELAQARDQVRPLSDEVDRYRREAAQRKAVAAPVPPSTLDMSGAALAGGAIAPSVTEPMPAFVDAPRGTADDLTVLKGVGDRFAAQLNAIGVFHYRQIADWTPEEMRIADAKLDAFRGRIERDQLVDQARLLAAGRTTEYEARFGKIGG